MLKLTENIKTQFTDLQKQNKTITKDIIVDMTSKNQEHHQNVNISLLQTLNEMKTTFKNITENFQQNIDSSLTQSSNTHQQFLNQFHHINEKMLQQIELSQNQLAQVTDRLHDFSKDLGQNIIEAHQIVNHIRESVNTFHQASEQQTQNCRKK